MRCMTKDFAQNPQLKAALPLPLFPFPLSTLHVLYVNPTMLALLREIDGACSQTYSFTEQLLFRFDLMMWSVAKSRF
jgi:hypothetical protein